MAEKRMLSKKITNNDNFLSLSSSAQALYMHLSMASDDDGFCNEVSLSMFKAHASVQDLEALIDKKYIYQFESGVIVIKHWKMANVIRKERRKPTVFQDELSMLTLKENQSYTWADKSHCGLLADKCQTSDGQVTDKCQTNVSIDKNSIDKNSIDKISIGEYIEPSETAPAPPKKEKHKFGEYNHVKLTDKEYDTLKNDFGFEETKEAIKYLDEYIEMKGTKYTSHYMALRKWVFEAIKEKKNKNVSSSFDEALRNA